MSSSSKTKAFAALEKQCIVTVNTLISKCKLCVPPVSSIRDINCELIISIFESITNIIIPDLLSTTNKVEEAHNVQAVIDTLSLDILGISLSHITGEDIVSGNLVSISNLLEVLHGIILYSGSSSSDNSYKRPNLKRKVSQKRKNPSPTLSRTLRQRSSNYKPATEAIQRKDKVPGHTESVDGLPNEPQNKTPRRVTTRKKQIQKENGKSVDTQSQIQSSTKSPPAKIRKQQTNRKQILSPKQSKPALNDKMSCGKTSRSSLRLQLKSVKAKADQPIKTTKRELIRKVSTKENRTTLNSKTKPVNSLVKELVSKPTTTCETVEDLHEKNLERKIKVVIDTNSYLTSRASHMKKWHFPNARKPVQSSIPSCKKSFLLPYTLRPKPVRKKIMRRKTDGAIPFQNNNQNNTDIKVARKAIPGLIKDINEDFPGLELPPSVVSLITKKYQQHLINMHKKARNCLLKVPKTEVQIEEAAEKQSAISNLLRKDMRHQQHMKELKENKENANKLKYHLRNSRMQSVKMKQYCKEFQLEMRKKMTKRNYAEELIYEKVFEDALQIQKEQVDRLCKEYKEAGETDARKQLIYLDALENLYQSQFNMMSEALASQKQETQDQVKAEKQAMDLMHREFQDELKKEIRFMQQAIIECTEDIHFRELDAEECTEKLRKIMS